MNYGRFVLIFHSHHSTRIVYVMQNTMISAEKKKTSCGRRIDGCGAMKSKGDLRSNTSRNERKMKNKQHVSLNQTQCFSPFDASCFSFCYMFGWRLDGIQKPVCRGWKVVEKETTVKKTRNWEKNIFRFRSHVCNDTNMFRIVSIRIWREVSVQVCKQKKKIDKLAMPNSNRNELFFCPLVWHVPPASIDVESSTSQSVRKK